MLATAWLLAVIAAASPENGRQFVSFAGVTLDETTTLSDLTARFGDTKLQESGEAGGYEASICYVTDTAIISFRSHEMGGPERRVLGFSVSKIRKPNHCARAPSQLNRISLEIGGLRLGISQEDFSSLVGHTEPIDGSQCRIYKSKWPMTPEEATVQDAGEADYFDETTSVCGAFDKAILVEYLVWRIRTT